MRSAQADKLDAVALTDAELKGYIRSETLHALLAGGVAPKRNRRPSSSRVDWDGNETAEEQRVARNDEAYAMRIGMHIQQHYPNVLFRVSVNSPGGIARIHHPLLPVKWGYTIFLSELNSDPKLACVTRACGELLERFNLPRGRYRRDLWEEARQKHWRTAAGIMPIVYNNKTGRFKQELPPELVR
jgi:hypothetical protein